MMRLDDAPQRIADAASPEPGDGQAPIASIEPLLLRLAHAPNDRTLLDALLGCARTVERSARFCGLDAVVAFTHPVELLLRRLHQGEITLTPYLSALLLQCNAQIRQLIDEATGGVEEAGGTARRAALVACLQAALRPASLLRPDSARP